MGRTLGHLRGLVWFGGTCLFLCETLYSARGSLNEYCRSSPVAMLLPQPVSCLCIVNCASCPPILFCTTHSPYPRLTPVQPARTSEPTANAKRLFVSKRTSLVSVKYEHYQQQRTRVSSHTKCNQSTSLYQWRILIEVGTICAIAGGWCKTPLQPCAFIPIRRNPSRKVDIPNW